MVKVYNLIWDEVIIMCAFFVECLSFWTVSKTLGNP
jgi:hypothetical protein